MLEFFVVAVLALHGLVCTVILILVLWKSARRRDLDWAVDSDGRTVPEKIEPPETPIVAEDPLSIAGGTYSSQRYPAAEILPIMAEHFPEEYERYKRGELPRPSSRRLWDTCCAIRDAREEIEELCS